MYFKLILVYRLNYVFKKNDMKMLVFKENKVLWY